MRDIIRRIKRWSDRMVRYHGGKIAVACGVFVLGSLFWMLYRHHQQVESDCVSICKSRGHQRFAVESTNACYCSGPEGAYSPGPTGSGVEKDGR